MQAPEDMGTGRAPDAHIPAESAREPWARALRAPEEARGHAAEWVPARVRMPFHARARDFRFEYP